MREAMGKISATAIRANFKTIINLARRGVTFAAAVIALGAVLSFPARAAELTGTWQGTIISGGEALEFEAAFSEEGYLLLEYTNNKGLVRIAELQGPGRIEFVPPGGGVSTVDVKAVVRRPNGITYLIESRFERAGGGYSDQRFFSEQYDYTLTNEGLHVRSVIKSAVYAGDRSSVLGGPMETEVSEGVLRKVQ